MKLPLVAALNRGRMRRRIALERARLTELQADAAEAIGAQRDRVARLEGPAPTARDIARRIEHREKAALLRDRHAPA